MGVMIKTKWRKKAKSLSFFFFLHGDTSLAESFMSPRLWINWWWLICSILCWRQLSSGSLKHCSFDQTQSSDGYRNGRKLARVASAPLRRCYSVCAAARLDSPLNRCHRFLCVWDTCTCIYSEVFRDLLKLPKTVLQQAKHLRSLWNQSVILSVWTFEPSSREPACPQTTDNTGVQKTERRQRELQQRHKELRYLPHCEKKKKTSQFGAVANLCLVHLMKTAHCALSAFVIACLWFFNQTRVIKTNLAGTGANLFPNHNLFPSSSSSSCPAVNQYTEQ